MKKLLTLIIMLLPLFALGQDSIANAYYEQGMDLYRTEQSHLAIPCLLKSDSLEKAQLDKTSPNYNRSAKQLIISYSDLANFFFKHSNPDLAFENQIQAIKFCKRVYGKKHPEYITAKKTLAKMKFFFSGKGGADDYYNYGMELKQDHPYDAFSYFQKADTLEKATLDPSSPNYYRSALEIADIKNGMADYWFSIKHYAWAFDFKNDAAEIYKKAFGEEDDRYIGVLRKLVRFSYLLSNYSDCISYQTTLAEVIKNKYGEDSWDYIEALRDICKYYGSAGNRSEQFKLNNRIAEITKKSFGEESPQYIKILLNIASDYEGIRDSHEAIKNKTFALELTKKVYSEDSPEYVSLLDQLSISYSNAGNDTMAIRLGTKVLEIRKKSLTETSSEYAKALSQLAMLYYRAAYSGHDDYYPEAIKLQKTAVEILSNNATEDEKNDTIYRWCSVLGAALVDLAAIYNDSGNPAEAIKCQTLAIEHEQLYLGHNIDISVMYGETLADYYIADGRFDEGANLFKEVYNSRIVELSDDYAGLSSDERTRNWNGSIYYEHFFGDKIPFAAYKCSSANDTILADLAYNGIVLTKGFLLNSEFEILNLIEQKGSSDLKERYYKFKNIRTTLDSLYQIPTEKRTINADSLAKAITHEEHELTTLALRLGDYIGNLAIEWTEIQSKLNVGDIAIEFAYFKDDKDNNTYYAAFVIKKGMKSPVCVPLFEIEKFKVIKSADYYNTSKLYNLVWKPLAKYLQDVKRVYFSPAGHLHTIGIEYLPDESGKIFAEKFAAYRLSSTRELALNRTINPHKKATTYGGIKYNFTEEDWRNVKFENDSIRSFRDVPQIAASLRGGGMVYLAGTREESVEVAKLLRSADYAVDALSDAAATEESFKRLSGTGLKILHIGTHGFYESEVDLENAGLKFFADTRQDNKEDRSLSCSGLLFAGANSALDPRRNKEIPEGANDGILTAKEISRLDFRSLDLVVLSACQTGLGEVTGEGVFGLQRGFKKAGAQTIIMSLWKVFDDSTQLLITEFFKNFTAGQSKRASFAAAQKVVRAQYPDPEHWAAFVMVDGMD